MGKSCSSGVIRYICVLPISGNPVHWIAEPFISTGRVILFNTTTAPFMTTDGTFRVERVSADPFISMLTVQPSVLQTVTIICKDFTTEESARSEYIPGDVYNRACKTFHDRFLDVHIMSQSYFVPIIIVLSLCGILIQEC